MNYGFLTFPKYNHIKSDIEDVRNSLDYPKAWAITEDEENWYLTFVDDLFKKHYGKDKKKKQAHIFNIGWTKKSAGPIRTRKEFRPPNYWKIRKI